MTQIRSAAVLGAGTMGGAIAALCANAEIPVLLLDIAPGDLTPEEAARGLRLDDRAVRNRIVEAGWAATLRARPPALALPELAEYVELGNLADDFERLGEADWICEAVTESLPIKRALMARIEAVRKPTAVVSTNTSGLLIRDIAAGRGEAFGEHFLGMHFFNPPRYLKLVEVIPHAGTRRDVGVAMMRFGEEVLGKGVILCKDTPNFIGNRLFAVDMAFTLGYALEHGYTVEEVDSLTGPLIGRPRSATFRLLDLVGLDVMEHINRNLYPAIPHDPARDLLIEPRMATLYREMIGRGWLGNKSGVGFYKPVETDGGKAFWTLDFETMRHRPPRAVAFESVERLEKIEPLEARLRVLVEAGDRAGELIRAVTYQRLAYAASCVPEIADELVSIDRAARWGYAHQLGPFEEWDALGVARTVDEMEADGLAVAGWVKDMLAGGCESFYEREGGEVIGYYDVGVGGYM